MQTQTYTTILIRNSSLDDAMSDALDYQTGFSKENIHEADKASYAKGVYTVIDALFDAYESDEEMVKKSQDLVSQIFSVPGSKDSLEHFLKRLSSDLNCPSFKYTTKTILDDINKISAYLKENYPLGNFDFNSFMAGVKCIVGPIKKTYDKMTGVDLKQSSNFLLKAAGYAVNTIARAGMSILKLDEKAQPIIDKLSEDINLLYCEHVSRQSL